jgi:hypothetical protein
VSTRVEEMLSTHRKIATRMQSVATGR